MYPFTPRPLEMKQRRVLLIRQQSVVGAPMTILRNENQWQWLIPALAGSISLTRLVG